VPHDLSLQNKGVLSHVEKMKDFTNLKPARFGRVTQEKRGSLGRFEEITCRNMLHRIGRIGELLLSLQGAGTKQRARLTQATPNNDRCVEPRFPTSMASENFFASGLNAAWCFMVDR